MMKNNKLQLNADKTEYLIVTSPNVLPKITFHLINISGIEIEPSVSAKNLGVMFDKQLNMCEHMNQIYRKTQFLSNKSVTLEIVYRLLPLSISSTPM